MIGAKLARLAGLLLRLVLVGLAFFDDHAWNGDRLKCHTRGVVVLARSAPFACLPRTTTPPAAALALVAIRFSFTAAVLAGRGILGQAFGLVGFHFGSDFDVDRLVLVGSFLPLRRESPKLRPQQRPCSFHRV